MSATATSNTVPFNWTSERRGRSTGEKRRNRSSAITASRMPLAPPTVARIAFSISEPQTSRHVGAPRALQTLVSRYRMNVRASWAFARLSDAISRRPATAAMRNQRPTVALPTIASRIGWRAACRGSGPLSRSCAGIWRTICTSRELSSAWALSIVTPDLRRPRQIQLPYSPFQLKVLRSTEAGTKMAGSGTLLSGCFEGTERSAFLLGKWKFSGSTPITWRLTSPRRMVLPTISGSP